MDSLTSDLREIIGHTLPIIILVSVMASVLRIYLLKRSHKKIKFATEIPNLFFLIYILCLFQIVTSQDVSGIHGINITFFKELTRYEFGTHLFYKNIIGNIVLFMPFSFFIAHIFKINNGFIVSLFTLLASLIIESIQLSIGRAFDVDDVILNLIGGIIGFLLYKVINYIIKDLRKDVRDIIFAVFLVITVMGIFLILL